MPVYEFVCDNCYRQTEAFMPVSQCDQPPRCTCGQQMRRVYGGHNVIVDAKAHDREALRLGEY